MVGLCVGFVRNTFRLPICTHISAIARSEKELTGIGGRLPANFFDVMCGLIFT